MSPMSPRLLRPRAAGGFTPKNIGGLALWLDAADSASLYTTDAGPVTAVNSPLDIAGCVLWLDGADASTVTAPGGIVSEWRDKTAGARHFTASSTAQPTYTATLNGRNVLTFNGSTNTLAGNAAANDTIRNRAGYTFFAVSKVNSVAAGERLICGFGATVIFRAGQTGSSPYAGGRRVGGDTLENITGAASSLVSGSSYITSALVSHTAQSIAGNLNGSIFASDTTYMAAGNSENAAMLASVGSQSSSYGFYNGDIAEVIIFDTALSTADRARVEAYLATKWGISGVHRPVAQEITAVGSPLELTDCALWLDADQSVTPSLFDATVGGSAVTAENGTVARWQDKSGNNRHATQSASANRPLFKNSSYNGRPCLNGSGDRFMVCEGANINAPSLTVFAVYRLSQWQTGTAPLDKNPNIYHTDLPASGFNSFGLRSEQGSGSLNVRSGDADSSAPYTLTGITSTHQGQTAIQATRLIGSTGAIVSRVSGTQAASATVAGTNLPASFGSRVSVMTGFYELDANRRLFGDLAEFIIFRRDLSDTDIQRVEKYLAAKWGIANVPDPTPPVGYWGDKSGSGRHVTQSISASRPTLTAVATRTAVNFDGTDDTIWFPQGIPSDNLSVFCVFKYDTLNGGIVYDCGYTGDNTNAQHSGFTLFLNAAGMQVNTLGGITHRLDSNRPSGSNEEGRSSLSGGAVAANAVTLSTIAATYGTTPLRYGARDGGELTGTSRFNGTIWSVVNLGSRRNAGTLLGAQSVFFDGQICEFLIYEQNLPQNQRRRIESYLATKWGITLAPQVSNADAQDWINRVYSNGGTVSTATANAVNTFCNSIESAGIRDRFFRLNPFAGTGLSAALVPLYRGPSPGGTQFGSATDTNNNFVSADYVETGATGGLLGNATTKHLNTGFRTQDLASVSDCHLSVWWRGGEATETRRAIGAIGTSQDSFFIDARTALGGGNQSRLGGSTNFGPVSGLDTDAQSIIVSRTSTTNAVLYKNGSSIATQTASVTGVAGTSQAFGVFTALISGTTTNGSWPYRLNGYSIGAGLSGAQASSFHTAWAAFQNALLRDRPSSDPAFAAVTNAEAKLWIDRVYANGGTVSTATANAVNTFCNSIESAGIRNRLYRLNVFAGSNLSAALVPLYRGPSPSGTQYGNVTDTNLNFVSGDYVEGGGLTGTGNNGVGAGNSKHLNTGLQPTAWPSISSFHASAFVFGVDQSGPTQSSPIGIRNNTAPANRWGFDYRNTSTQFHNGANLNNTPAVPISAANQHWVVSRSSATLGHGYINGVTQFTDSTDISSTLTARANPFFVFAVNTDTIAAAFGAFRMGGYSLGESLTQSQAAAFHSAFVALTNSLANIPAVSNAEAQDWVNRVHASGGTVSTATANAVNTFVEGCVSDGIWGAMKSVGLLCGASNLAGALTPLKGTAPTNFNFVSGDYDRKLGLLGNGTTKYLNSNRANSADPQNSKHLALFVTSAGNATRRIIGSQWSLNGGSELTRSGTYNFRINAAYAANVGALAVPGTAHFLGASRSDGSDLTARAGATTSTLSQASVAPDTTDVLVYYDTQSYSSGRFAFYSIGESLDLALLDSRFSTLYAAIGATTS